MVKCNYTPGLVGPRWQKFLEDTFGDLAPWIQKAVGYSITGSTKEKVVFMLLGKTDTGKTTFLTALGETFADYAKRIQIETLMWSKHEDNNTNADLAELRGARFVTTSETEEGQRLREAKLKRITQGMGQITATRKFENPITFTETHKLWLDANFAPDIRGTDNAIWNRLLPIPCTNLLSEGQKDRGLIDRLLLEREAIAAWAVAGAVRWYTEGLGPIPGAIEQRRGAWRAEMDFLGDFLADTCDEDHPRFTVSASALYAEYKKRDPHPMPQTAFGCRMADRGYVKAREARTGRIIYHGLKLKVGVGGMFGAV
jgi:putative DNA primase/helicase